MNALRQPSQIAVLFCKELEASWNDNAHVTLPSDIISPTWETPPNLYVLISYFYAPKMAALLLRELGAKLTKFNEGSWHPC